MSVRALTDKMARERLTVVDAPAPGAVLPLGRGGKGVRGVVVRVGLSSHSHDPKVVSLATRASRGSTLDRGELERRLIEIGFVEGAARRRSCTKVPDRPRSHLAVRGWTTRAWRCAGARPMPT